LFPFCIKQYLIFTHAVFISKHVAIYMYIGIEFWFDIEKQAMIMNKYPKMYEWSFLFMFEKINQKSFTPVGV